MQKFAERELAMNSFRQKLINKINEKQDEMIEIRHHLHQHPEISWKEHETEAYIYNYYKDLDCEVTRNVGDGLGLTVLIDSGNPGKTVALRADFDALEIQEKTNVPYISQNSGVMHACGHDAHTAYLMVLAKSLIELKSDFSGKVLIIHQNAEEVTPGGAIGMVNDNIMNGVDAVFGAHVMTNGKLGEVKLCPGNAQTGRGNFKLTISGTAGHASTPQLANDAILASAYFITEVQSVISRRIDPFEMATISINSIDGRGPVNAVNDHVEIIADLRAMSPETQEKVEVEIKRILEGIKAGFAIDYEITFTYDYPVLHNNEELCQMMDKVMQVTEISELKDYSHCGPQAPSEDFAEFALKVPGLFFYVGCTPEGKEETPHHNPYFYCDDGALIIAAKTMASLVDEYLNGDN